MKNEISPVIYEAIEVLRSRFGGTDVQLISDDMFRLEPTEYAPAGRLGVYVEIEGIRVFLGCESNAEDMLGPLGGAFADEFIYAVMKEKREISDNLYSREIQTNESEYIVYDGNIMIIKRDDLSGKLAKFQYGGVNVLPGIVRGDIEFSFKSSNNLFDPEYWYVLTSWGSNYPEMLYFEEIEGESPLSKISIDELFNMDGENGEKFHADCDVYADANSIKGSDLLETIMAEVRKESGVEYEIDFDDMTYGVNWWESLVPIKFGDSKFLLTWENCD
jgi:hypothetical protein